MAYLFSRLSGKAKSQVMSGVKDDGTFTYTCLADMVLVLKQAFGALNQQAEASAAILSYKQGTKALADFLPAWMELQSLSRFDDTASIAILKMSLHPLLINRLSYTQVLKPDLSGFIIQVREADTILRSLESTYHKKVTSSPVTPPLSQPPLTTTQGGDAMDLNTVVV